MYNIINCARMEFDKMFFVSPKLSLWKYVDVIMQSFIDSTKEITSWSWWIFSKNKKTYQKLLLTVLTRFINYAELNR